VIGDLLIALGMVASAAILAGTGFRIARTFMDWQERLNHPVMVVNDPEEPDVLASVFERVKLEQDPGPPRQVDQRPVPIGGEDEPVFTGEIRWAPGPEMIPPVQPGRR
jgi:hypothetical protein